MYPHKVNKYPEGKEKYLGSDWKDILPAEIVVTYCGCDGKWDDAETRPINFRDEPTLSFYRKSLREEGEEMVKELKRRREEDELYNRKLLEEGAATRTLLVIAAGHPDPVRLAKEVLRSKIGVTEEVLDAPMWKVSEDA